MNWKENLGILIKCLIQYWKFFSQVLVNSCPSWFNRSVGKIFYAIGAATVVNKYAISVVLTCKDYVNCIFLVVIGKKIYMLWLSSSCGFWLCGLSRSGKDYEVQQFFNYLFVKMRKNWWNGCKGGYDVLISDLETFHAPFMGYPSPWEFFLMFKEDLRIPDRLQRLLELHSSNESA